MRPVEVKVPVEPLLALFPSMGEMARAVGVGRTRISKAQRAGGITVETAERWCDAARVHPASVWPEWVSLVAPKPADLRVCAADGCDNRFVPVPGKKFCHPRCRARMQMRAAYERDPEAKREMNRRARDPEFEKRRNRSYYRANRERLLAKQWERDEAKRQARRAS